MVKLWDVTVSLETALPSWPGESSPHLKRLFSISEGAVCNVTELSTSVHCGTHVDAPIHFFDGTKAIEALSLDTLMGPARLIHVPGVQQIEPAHLDAANLAGVERLLIKTDNSALWDNPGHPFYEDFVALTAGAAQWCVDHGIKLVGIDYLSVELFHAAEPEVHRLLLGAGIVPVEGLDLRAVGPGDYHLICLPMKIAGSDGAPARVLLLERPPL